MVAPEMRNSLRAVGPTMRSSPGCNTCRRSGSIDSPMPRYWMQRAIIGSSRPEELSRITRRPGLEGKNSLVLPNIHPSILVESAAA